MVLVPSEIVKPEASLALGILAPAAPSAACTGVSHAFKSRAALLSYAVPELLMLSTDCGSLVPPGVKSPLGIGEAIREVVGDWLRSSPLYSAKTCRLSSSNSQSLWTVPTSDSWTSSLGGTRCTSATGSAKLAWTIGGCRGACRNAGTAGTAFWVLRNAGSDELLPNAITSRSAIAALRFCPGDLLALWLLGLCSMVPVARERPDQDVWGAEELLSTDCAKVRTSINAAAAGGKASRMAAFHPAEPPAAACAGGAEGGNGCCLGLLTGLPGLPDMAGVFCIKSRVLGAHPQGGRPPLLEEARLPRLEDGAEEAEVPETSQSAL